MQRIVSFVFLVASLKILEISFWWILVLPLGFLLLWKLDKYIFYPGEANAATLENPQWRRLIALLELLLERLESLIARDRDESYQHRTESEKEAPF